MFSSTCFCSLFRPQPSPWKRAFLEKLTGSQLINTFPEFYETLRFITAFARARHLSLSWARSIQSMSPHPTAWDPFSLFHCLYRKKKVSPSPSAMIPNITNFCGQTMFAPPPNAELNDHPLSAILHIRGPFLHPQHEYAPCCADMDQPIKALCRSRRTTADRCYQHTDHACVCSFSYWTRGLTSTTHQQYDTERHS